MCFLLRNIFAETFIKRLLFTINATTVLLTIKIKGLRLINTFLQPFTKILVIKRDIEGLSQLRALLDQGLATPEEIDFSVIHGLALRLPVVGILAKADFTGLPLVNTVLTNGSYVPPPEPHQSPTLDKLVAEGRTGVMAGKGFYDWGDRTPAELFRERDRRLLALKQALRGVRPMMGKDTL